MFKPVIFKYIWNHKQEIEFRVSEITGRDYDYYEDKIGVYRQFYKGAWEERIVLAGATIVASHPLAQKAIEQLNKMVASIDQILKEHKIA